jgi:hypothetical protein
LIKRVKYGYTIGKDKKQYLNNPRQNQKRYHISYLAKLFSDRNRNANFQRARGGPVGGLRRSPDRWLSFSSAGRKARFVSGYTDKHRTEGTDLKAEVVTGRGKGAETGEGLKDKCYPALNLWHRRPFPAIALTACI